MGVRDSFRLLAASEAFNASHRSRDAVDDGNHSTVAIRASAEDLGTRFSGNALELWDRRPEPARWSADRPITAAGARINLKNADDIMGLRNRVYTEWQNDAWAYYDAIGEIKYGLGIVASSMSRLRLYSAVVFNEDMAPVSVSTVLERQAAITGQQSDPDTTDELKPLPELPGGVTSDVLQYMDSLLRDLRSGGGTAGMLRMFALNLSVAGECYLVQIKKRWYVKSTSELIVSQGGQIILRSQRAGSSTTTAGTVYGDVVLPPSTFIARIWREHPRYSHEPESSMLGLREACDELITLQRMVRTVARSRMHAGVLYVPDGLAVAGGSVAEDVANEEEEWDALNAAIYDSITAPITDETSAASVVPIILTGPGEESKNLRYVEINRNVDQWLAGRLEDALKRVLQGLDVPREVTTGMAQAKFANAKHITDSMYTEHLEPMALMFCDAITSVFLRPLVKRKFPQLTDEDLDALCIWYDPSELVIKADDSDAADKGFDNFALGADAWRRANGFTDSDAPSEQELAQRYMLTKAVPGPDQVATLFKTVFPTVTDAARAANLQQSPVPMPESAQQLLYGKVVAPPDGSAPAPATQQRGADGAAPSTPEYTNRNNQETSASMLRDKTLSNGGYTRNGAPGAGSYGKY